MKRLSRPLLIHGDVFDACIRGVDDPVLAGRFNQARTAVLAIFAAYEINASQHQLFSLAASDRGNGNQQVLAGMNKNEFVDLYSTYMVKKPAGRHYYDQLMTLAPLGKCPYCGFGQVSTLDHFLSKSRYPAFSVLHSNLVPSCADCNKGKGAPVVTGDNQILNPYFEDSVIESDPWLFAEAIPSTPIAIRYFIRPPAGWQPDLVQRLSNYFHDLGLARRFSIEAATEVTQVREYLDAAGAAPAVQRAHLETVARVERRNRTNSWKAALYEALAQAPWFVMNEHARDAEVERA